MRSNLVKMLQIYKLFVVLPIFTITSSELQEVLFLIASQSTHFHHQLSENLRADILQQYEQNNTNYSINVQLLSEIFSKDDWTLLNVMPKLGQNHANIISTNTTWIIWCEESTHINLEPLLLQLSKRNYNEPLFLGYALHDHEATIIHHFAFFEDPAWFPYPMLRAGIIFSIAMYKRLSDVLLNKAQHLTVRRTQFTIDVAHELALLIYDNIREVAATTTTTTPTGVTATNVNRTKNKGRKMNSNKSINNLNGTNGKIRKDNNKSNSNNNTNNNSSVNANDDYNSNNSEIIRIPTVQRTVTTATTTETTTTSPSSTVIMRKILLQHALFICRKAKQLSKQCAMYAKPMDLTTCVPVQRACIYFAIKTCRRFHKKRIPLLESTWTPFTVHKKFYSDTLDIQIPTYSTGVPNSNGGHCAKTLAIFKLALNDIEQMNRQNATVHHNVNDVNATATIHWLFLADDDTLLSVARLAEFLGCFNASEQIYLGERYGYRMHANDGFSYITGGGGIAISIPALRQIVQHCKCPSASAPDDMILGACMRSLHINAIHTARFHQARSLDYARELLQLEPPITFHKFWQLDNPLAEYARWFRTADRQMLQAEHAMQEEKLKPFRNVSHQHCNSIKGNNAWIRCYSAQQQLIQNEIYSNVVQNEQQRLSKGRHIEL